VPPATHPTFDVAVVGGGIAGLAVAWRAATAGLSVCVLDRDELAAQASHVAAGMLAPVTEADSAELDLLALGIESARRWPEFAEQLHEASGVEVGYRRCGTLVVARDRDEAEALERELELRERLGLRVGRVLPSAARRLEPALAPSVRLALEAPDDHAVDPRAVCAALAAASERAGVVLRPGTDVTDVVVHRERVDGVATASGDRIACRHVVVAAGPWSGALPGIPPAARVPMRPVKGQILRLREPHGLPLLERVVRFEGGYLVPRGDGRIVLGATMEERGFDTAVTALGVYELLRDAAELVPGVLELELEEAMAGLRPATPDNAPALGACSAIDGLVYATGHHRNGVLLAPVTADLVAADLVAAPRPHPFSPDRFARVAA
jgi:glycine oxidase